MITAPPAAAAAAAAATALATIFITTATYGHFPISTC